MFNRTHSIERYLFSHLTAVALFDINSTSTQRILADWNVFMLLRSHALNRKEKRKRLLLLATNRCYQKRQVATYLWPFRTVFMLDVLAV